MKEVKLYVVKYTYIPCSPKIKAGGLNPENQGEYTLLLETQEGCPGTSALILLFGKEFWTSNSDFVGNEEFSKSTSLDSFSLSSSIFSWADTRQESYVRLVIGASCVFSGC